MTTTLRAMKNVHQKMTFDNYNFATLSINRTEVRHYAEMSQKLPLAYKKKLIKDPISLFEWHRSVKEFDLGIYTQLKIVKTIELLMEKMTYL